MKINVIRSREHNIYTEKINKVALSGDDDKRIILEDGIHTLALGHFKSNMIAFLPEIRQRLQNEILFIFHFFVKFRSFLEILEIRGF